MIFLKLKHWQVFVLIAPTTVIGFIKIFTMLFDAAELHHVLRQIEGPAIIISAVLVQVWVYFIITELRSFIPQQFRINLSGYYLSLTIIVIIQIVVLLSQTIRNQYSWYERFEIWDYFGFFLGLYNMSIAGRTLVSAEKGTSVKFTDSQSTWLLFIFYFLGVWWLQPRINSVVGRNDRPVEPGTPLDRL
jgi:hypothetical protein